MIEPGTWFPGKEISYDDPSNSYIITEEGTRFNYEIENPDFNVKQFLSNLVFRWEYRPASYLYLVWSQTRSGYDPWGYFHFGDDFMDMWDAHPTNILMMKVSYRIGR